MSSYVVQPYSINQDTFPTFSVFNTPQWVTSYDVSLTVGPPQTTQTVVNARSVTAAQDVEGKNYSLTLGATKDVVVESLQKVNSYASQGFNYYYTTSTTDSNNSNVRTDDVILSVTRSADSNTTNFSTSNHKLSIGFSNQMWMNTVYVTSSNNNTFDTIGTTKNNLVISSATSFSSNVAIQGNMITYGSIFGCNINVWNKKSTADSANPSDFNKVGYGFTINSNDQLELIKISTFNDNSQARKRIAIFGMSEVGSNTGTDNSYMVFDALNSNPVSTYNNGSLITATSPLDNYMFPQNGNIGVFTNSPSAPFTVASNALFTSSVTVAGDLTVQGSFISSSTSATLGSSSSPLAGGYLGSAGLSLGAANQVKLQQNTLGTGATSLTVKSATTNALCDVVCAGVSCSSVTSSGTISASAISMPTGTITASNATIHTINVVNQIVTPGQDYAEYVTKADPTAEFKSGQIVGLDANGKVTASFADSLHFMVVSTQPSIIGGGDPAGDSPDFAALNEKLGFCGRVPVAVEGPASVGDYIVPVASSSGDGSIVGVALAPAAISLAQYMQAVGHVISADEDGTLTIILKQ